MIIYYINNNSRLNGPYDIRNSLNERHLKMGDFCIIDRSNYVDIIYIDKTPTQSLGWTDFHLLEHLEINTAKLPTGNYILFKLDGINKRTGDINGLILFNEIFKQDSVKLILTNAIDILSFKSDKIEASLLYKMLSQDEKPANKEVNSFTCMPFYNLLSLESQEYFIKTYKDNNSYRESFRAINELYNNDFTNALNQFKQRYPDKSIYFINDEINTNIGVELIKEALQEKGFVEIDNNIWKHNNKKYKIDVSIDEIID